MMLFNVDVHLKDGSHRRCESKIEPFINDGFLLFSDDNTSVGINVDAIVYVEVVSCDEEEVEVYS